MRIALPAAKRINLDKYKKEDLDLAREFSKKLFKEMGTVIKALVVFGSGARTTQKKSQDIDVMVVIDDITTVLTPEFVEAYRIIVQKTIDSVSNRLHVMSLKLTSFWEYLRAGDPIAINILRDGIALLDCGFFDPFQALLYQGRIRPTEESIWTYYGRAPRTLLNSKWHLTQATIDLYWAVIDAAHAALMRIGEIPPTPAHVADMMRLKLVKKGMLESSHVSTMDKFYKLMKMITHREIKEISASEYERYYKEADKFVQRIEKFIREHTRELQKELEERMPK